MDQFIIIFCTVLLAVGVLDVFLLRWVSRRAYANARKLLKQLVQQETKVSAEERQKVREAAAEEIEALQKEKERLEEEVARLNQENEYLKKCMRKTF